MGKFHSKHVCRREGPEGECFLVDAQFNAMSDESAPSESDKTSALIKKAGFLEDQVPLRVVLPPLKPGDNRTAQIFTIDKQNAMTPDLDTTDNNVTDNSINNVEEYECGVSVAGTDKQEWAFTLYDFDGRGKITKEDLAQLLKSLYDAVGSSITLPQTGAESLKLKLTVSPDRSKLNALNNNTSPTNNCSIPVSCGRGGGGENGTVSTVSKSVVTMAAPSSNNVKSSNAAALKSGSKRKSSRNNHHHHHHHHHNKENSKLMGKDQALAELTGSCSKKDSHKAVNRLSSPVDCVELKNNLSSPTTGVVARSSSPPHGVSFSAPQICSREPQTGAKSGSGEAGSSSPMSSSEKKQLVELVQKNMERHQRQLKKIRRHNSDQVRHSSHRHSRNCHPFAPTLPLNPDTNNPSTHPGTSSQIPTLATSQENPDRRNYYMDLAGIDHNPAAVKLLNTSAPANILEPVLGRVLKGGVSPTPVTADSTVPKESAVVPVREKDSKHKRHRKHHHHKETRKDKDVSKCHKQLNVETELACGADTALVVVNPGTAALVEQNAEKLAELPDISATVAATTLAPANTSPKERLSPRFHASTPKQHHKVRPISTPPVVLQPCTVDTAVSPHHIRRHKHRAKQNQRAMAQVAAWIEREHSMSPKQHEIPLQPQPVVCSTGDQLVIQRHEHHHIHEHHHHHHYHHYHES